jgi:Family of unknown function (DUF5343)
MASHPYISGTGNIATMIAQLRKNFPATVTSDTVRKLGLASNNESYVINALRFLGVIDEEGKRTQRGQETFTIHDEEKFKKAFAGLVRTAYKDLFDLRADEAWKLPKSELIGYFRSADKTSELIATRQAAVFQVFRRIAGYEELPNSKGKTAAKQKAAKPDKVRSKAAPPDTKVHFNGGKKDMALTVRVEINLPAEASAETYDNIFKSIRANLIDE